jgi:protein-S-isoprenylcysteine O-methyltransferase Ste14
MLSFANAAVYAIAWTAQVMRVLAEERLLSQDPAYRTYKEDVRWRVIPGVF